MQCKPKWKFQLALFLFLWEKRKMKHKGTQLIETPRLILRMAQMTDAEPMFRNWASDPEVTKFLTWPTYQSIDSAYTILDMWIKEYEKPDFYQWMIELKEIGEPIGSISVVHHRDDIAEAEIGYCIGQSWWHKGIMTEALTAVMQFLFTEVGMNRIEAKHDIILILNKTIQLFAKLCYNISG